MAFTPMRGVRGVRDGHRVRERIKLSARVGMNFTDERLRDALASFK